MIIANAIAGSNAAAVPVAAQAMPVNAASAAAAVGSESDGTDAAGFGRLLAQRMDAGSETDVPTDPARKPSIELLRATTNGAQPAPTRRDEALTMPDDTSRGFGVAVSQQMVSGTPTTGKPTAVDDRTTIASDPDARSPVDAVGTDLAAQLALVSQWAAVLPPASAAATVDPSSGDIKAKLDAVRGKAAIVATPSTLPMPTTDATSPVDAGQGGSAQPVTTALTPLMAPSIAPSAAPAIAPSAAPAIEPTSASSVAAQPSPSVAPSATQTNTSATTATAKAAVTSEIAPSIATEVTQPVTVDVPPTIAAALAPAVVTTPTPSVARPITPSTIPPITPSAVASLVPSIAAAIVPSIMPTVVPGSERGSRPAGAFTSSTSKATTEKANDDAAALVVGGTTASVDAVLPKVEAVAAHAQTETTSLANAFVAQVAAQVTAHGPATVNAASPVAAAPAPTIALREQVGTPAWSNEVASATLRMAAGALQSASLRLTPDHLGPVDVQLRIDNGVANVTFNASHVETRQALEASRTTLDQMFSNQGIKLGDCAVGDFAGSRQGFDANGSQSSGQTGGSQRDGTARAANFAADADAGNGASTVTTRLSRAPGLVDTFA